MIGDWESLKEAQVINNIAASKLEARTLACITNLQDAHSQLLDAHSQLQNAHIQLQDAHNRLEASITLTNLQFAAKVDLLEGERRRS